MRGGSLHDRINIETATEAADGSGQLIRTWATYKANVPADHQYVTGGEQFRGKQVSAQSSHVFRIRTISGLTTEMRVLWGGTYYGIVNLKEPYNCESWLECKAADQ